jgi:hypothetical protein
MARIRKFDPFKTDPACELSPDHRLVGEAIERGSEKPDFGN